VRYPSVLGATDPFEHSATGCATKDELINSTQTMIRALHARAQSMPNPPGLFHISLRLYYVEGTPEEYEPSDDFTPHID
jgi:hypothetical protein